MNSRERMRTAMQKRTPDRVPFMCQLSLGHYFLNSDVPYLDIWHDSDGFARAAVQLQQRYGFDGILVNLPGRKPDWRRDALRVEENADGAVIHWKNGMTTVAPKDDNPHVYVGEGKRFFASFDEIDPEKLFYIEPHDTSGVAYPYSWAFDGDIAAVDTPEFFPPWQLDTLRRVLELTRGEVSVHAEVFSPLSQFIELLDVENALVCLVEDPGRTSAVLERLSAGAATLARLQLRAGADAVLISSAYAGARFISRRHYSQFELPYLKLVMQTVRKEFSDAPIYVHTCGAIGDRLDLMEQSGVDGIDTLDPPPLGTVDLAGALATLGKRVFIKGNIDPIRIVLQGSVEDVRTAARERVEIAAPGGAYILSTACSIPPKAPPQNIMAMREAVQ